MLMVSGAVHESVLRVGQPVHEAEECARNRKHARPIELSRLGGDNLLGGQGGERKRSGGEREEKVDVKTPSPRKPLGQRAAQQQSHHRAARCDRGVDAECTAAFSPGSECHVERGQRRRRQDRSEYALECPRGNQHAEPDRRPTDAGRRGEAEQPDEQCAASADDVGQSPSDQQQCTEGQRVRGDDPLTAFRAEAQGALRRR
jgi:hypothetical protein